jgi:uncharacterized membrane protein YozB (DUF420 family)
VVIVEIVFNSVYLLVIWAFVIVMCRRFSRVVPDDRGSALWLLLAFGLLALGDTGHVGFRVIAFARDGLSTTVSFMGSQWYLIVLGTIATAWTFTLFYVCLLFFWSRRFAKPFGYVAWFTCLLAVARSVIMLMPQNSWNSLEITQPWYFIRNLLLILMQVCTAYLILRDAGKQHDRPMLWIGYLIVVSLVCYVPVVLLVETMPAIGMLMIPKTLAYLGMLIVGFNVLYSSVPGLLDEKIKF